MILADQYVGSGTPLSLLIYLAVLKDQRYIESPAIIPRMGATYMEFEHCLYYHQECFQLVLPALPHALGELITRPSI